MASSPPAQRHSRTLNRYLRREVAIHAALGLLLFTFVIFMQDLGRALQAVVGAGTWSLLALFAYVLPQALVFTLPMAVLVGLLIGLGRLGVDNEIMALRACGFGARRQVWPLMQLATAAFALALGMSLWVAPAAQRRLTSLTQQWAGTAIASQIQPRVFFEPANNPNWVIYAGDLLDGGQLWRQVLVADMRHPSEPQLTMANSGRVVNQGPGRVQLHLSDGAQYTTSSNHPETSLVSAFQSVDIPLSTTTARAPASIALSAQSPGALWWRARFAVNWRAARVEFYRRCALAFACLALAILGAPLGLRGGRGGKSGGFVLTLMVVFGYYLIFVLGLGLARSGKLPPFLGVWAANLLCLAWGAVAIWRLDRVPRKPVAGTDPVAWVRAALSRRVPSAPGPMARRRWMPTLIEGYVIREFLGYTLLLLASFLVIVVVFTLFELSGSIIQNHIGPGLVIKYFFYFTPQMLYLMIPLAILVAVLITFGLMSKSNEVTALKACGVSAYRLLAPVMAAAILLCAIQFTLGATWLPAANQKQDALHNQIKGQAPQTYRDPEHKWVFGQHDDIYYFRFYDPGRTEFDDVSVFQFDPQHFLLTRRIFASDARWNAALASWVFTNGWVRTFQPGGDVRFHRFQVDSFTGLPERPAYFATDSRQGTQMSYLELRRYIQSLKSSGYDVAGLSVTLAKKISYPLITVIMALLAFPFALTVGRRGAVAGITVAIGVAIIYWSSASLLEALGNLNQLPAQLAAWTPDVLFFGAGIYLLLRVPT